MDIDIRDGVVYVIVKGRAVRIDDMGLSAGELLRIIGNEPERDDEQTYHISQVPHAAPRGLVDALYSLIVMLATGADPLEIRVALASLDDDNLDRDSVREVFCARTNWSIQRRVDTGYYAEAEGLRTMDDVRQRKALVDYAIDAARAERRQLQRAIAVETDAEQAERLQRRLDELELVLQMDEERARMIDRVAEMICEPCLSRSRRHEPERGGR